MLQTGLLTEKLYGLEVTSPRSYSPDLVPSDLHLFAHVKQRLCDRRFATDAEVTQALSS